MSKKFLVSEGRGSNNFFSSECGGRSKNAITSLFLINSTFGPGGGGLWGWGGVIC